MNEGGREGGRAGRLEQSGAGVRIGARGVES